MAQNQSSKNSLDELNKQVHELNYVQPSKSSQPRTDYNRKKGHELAKKIQKNIEAYQSEVNSRQRPSLQT